jgi:2-oxoisovalerate dehydrogenase E2 component (dihydrolipoyl transacylase)
VAVTRFLSTRQQTEIETIPFKLADIGEGITEVELLQWFVKEGDRVKSFDRICEVQSDKATVEITSRYDGHVGKLHYEVGEVMKVGQPIVNINQTEGSQAKLNENTLPEKSADDIVSNDSPPDAAAPVDVDFNNRSKGLLTTPAVRRIARERKIDLSAIKGSGPSGRILKEDVLGPSSGSNNRDNAPASDNTNVGNSKRWQGDSQSSPQGEARREVVPIRGIQKIMFQSMTSSKEIPHLTLTDEIVVDNLVKAKSDLKSWCVERNIKLTYLPFFIKATSLALKEYPVLNTSISEDNSNLIYHESHNIGIAMDTPKGLVVPVIHNVQSKSVLDIIDELKNLQQLAADGKLTERELTGATFSLSNIGSITGTYAVPVIVPPQVAIGAIGRFQVIPRYTLNGTKISTAAQANDPNVKVTPSTIMNISWSADHRVIDGATVARFSKLWSSYLENPMLISINSV